MDDWKGHAAQSLNMSSASQGEWAAKRFYGDAQVAAAYLPLAYQMLGSLTHRLALGGISVGSRQVELIDGTTIRVVRNGDQNTIEITTTPVEPAPFPATGGHGFIFYPKTDTARNGLYIPGLRGVVYPRAITSPPTLPPAAFATLSHTFDPIKGRVALQSTLPVVRQAGNQFFFDGSDVYSWWHSPCGDGALVGTAMAGTPGDYTFPVRLAYRPYCDDGSFFYLTEDATVQTIPKIIYRNGSPWQSFLYDTRWVISGFWTGIVTFTHDLKPSSERRYLIAFSYAKPELYTEVRCYRDGQGTTALERLEPTDSVRVTAISEFRPYHIGYHGFWPVRFSPDGSQLCTLECAATDPLTYISGRRDYVAVITATVTHHEKGMVVSAPAVVKTQGGQVTTTEYHTENTPQMKPVDILTVLESWNGPVRFGDREQHDYSGAFAWKAITGNHTEYADVQWPLAASYTADNTLIIAHYTETGTADSSFQTLTLNHQESSSIYTETWIDLGAEVSLHYKKIITSTNETTGTQQSSEGETIRGVFTLPGLSATVDVTAITASGSATSANKKFAHFSQDDSPSVGSSSLTSDVESTHVETGLTGNSGIYHIDVADNVLFVGTGIIRSASAYRTVSHWSGPSEDSLTGSGTQTSTVTVSAELAIQGYVRGQPVLLETLDKTVVANETVETLKWRISGITLDATSDGFSEDIVTHYPLPCRVIEWFRAPNPASTAADAARFSFAGDRRYNAAQGEPFPWAYSMRVRMNPPVPGHPPLSLAFTRTDSTYGALGQYLKTIDESGKATDQPVTDETLTVHPVGLY